MIIPWRGGCPYRETNLRRVVEWWEQRHPEWVVTVGEYPAGAGGWRKSMAVLAGGPVADTDIVIIADADVVCEQVGLAVDAVSRPRGKGLSAPLWAAPHHSVYRLTPAATAMVTSGAWWPTPAATTRKLMPYLERSYASRSPAGGMVVLLGRLLNEVPLDPRFIGWGQEDHSWALALSMLGGAHWQGRGLLWHLWHPETPRVQPGIGSTGGLHLWHRYRTASTPRAMRELVGEAHAEIERLTHVALR